jgi:hypothetical protein
MIRSLIQRYHSIQLHLGIKRLLNPALPFLWEIKLMIDNKFLYPLFNNMKKYFFESEIFHYGADYHWGDEKSQNLDIANYNYGYGLMHYALVKNIHPKRILCVGSMYGFIPYMLAKACMENNSGHVDFIDAAYDFNKPEFKFKHYFGQGFWRRTNSQKHFSYLLNHQYISTHVMTLEEFIEKCPHQYEYIYLDGDHSYPGLVRDIRLVWPHLIQGGILGLHDIEFDFKKSLEHVKGQFKQKVKFVSFGVVKIWDAFEKKSQTFPIYNRYSGLGFIYKNSNIHASLPDFLRSSISFTRNSK